MLKKVDDPEFDTNASLTTPSNEIDSNGNKKESFSEESLSQMEKDMDEGDAEDELHTQEPSEDNTEDEEPDWLKDDVIDELDLSPEEVLKNNITSFHRNQMKCLDKHFFAKPGEQLSYEKMLIECNGEDNIQIQKFYNDIDWQAKDFLRQTLRESLRPGYCDKIFMQCYEFMQNLEVFMSLNYDLQKSVKANMNVLLDKIEVENYQTLREKSLEVIVMYKSIMDLLEEKKEFMAEYFKNKQNQYTNEYGEDEIIGDEEETSHSEEPEDSEHSSEGSNSAQAKVENDKKAEKEALEEREKIDEQNRDVLNVYNDKKADPDAPFEKNKSKPSLNDVVPGFEKTPTVYPERVRGSDTVEVDMDKMNQLMNSQSDQERADAAREKAVNDKINMEYNQIMEIRNDLDKQDKDKDFDDAKVFNPTPSDLLGTGSRNLKGKKLSKKKMKELKIQRKVQEMLAKDLKKVSRKMNLRGKSKKKKYKKNFFV